MADIMSRIILQAQGGDQVAREVGKVTDAYKKAGTAAQGMSATAGGAGGDPFTRATAPGGFIPSQQRDRGEADDRYWGGVRDREGHQRNLAAANNKSARGIVTGGIGAFGGVGSGDIIGGASSGIGMLAGAGIAGIVAAGVAAGGMAVSKLANAEEARQTLGQGLQQAIAQGDWGTFREQVMKVRAGGFPEGLLVPYLQGLKAAGGRFDPNNAANIGEQMWGEGMEPGNVAQWQALRQRAGTGTLFPGRMETDLYRGGEAFGQAGSNRFIVAVSSAVEQAMTRGLERGGDVFKDTAVYTNFTRLLSALALPGVGNLTDVGAIQAMTQIQQAVASSTQMARPIDAFQFMAMRIPGESYGDTMRRMEKPGSELDFFRNLEAQAGGREEALEILVREQFGVSWGAVQPTIRAFRDQLDYIQGDFTRYVPGTSRAPIGDELLRAAQADAAAAELFEGTQRAARDLKSFFIELATDIKESAFPEEIRRETGYLYGAPQGIDIQLSSPYKQALRSYNRGTMNQIGMTLTPGARGIASILEGTEAGAAIIPQLMMYQQYLTGTQRVNAREAAQLDLFGPTFNEVNRLMSLPSIQEAFAQPETMATFMTNLEQIDAKQAYDSIKEVYTIVEVLNAIYTTLGLFAEQTTSDEGSAQ